MKMLKVCMAVLFTLLWTGYSEKCNATVLSGNEIVVCGDDKVLIIDVDKSDNEKVHVIWSWKVSDAADQLPAEYQKLMVPLDDCKPVDNNTKLLLTSSGDGAVLLDIATKKCLFYAHVPMAHSAEALPGDRIAVALSVSPQGNSIEIYDRSKPGQVLFRDSLYSGHGAVWMDTRKTFYALGYDVLRAYSLENWDSASPQLKLKKSFKIPVTSGHDLVKISDDRLLVTGHEGVYSFDLNKEEFRPFEPLHKVPNVKSVNYDEKTNRLVYTKAEISWWTHHIYCNNPDKVLTIEDINLYKVRMLEK